MSETGRHFDFELAIIGGGSAGYAAARTASAAGVKTVVIEGGEDVGGLCILRGCMPTKALLYAAEVMHLAGQAEVWGIHKHELGFNFSEVMARKNALIKEFADFREQQLTKGKFAFFRAHARFTDAHTLELLPHHSQSSRRKEAPISAPNPGGHTRPKHLPAKLTAKNFLSATGSIFAPSPLRQLKEIDCLNSDTGL